jgi:hypothetical protein
VPLAKRKPLIIVVAALLSLFCVVLSFNSSVATVLWSHPYPYGIDDHARAIALTTDGGYVLAGHSLRSGDAYHHGLIIKVDSSGTAQWSKSYGGLYTDEVHAVLQTSDGGYVASGVTWPTTAEGHMWLFKVDASGNLQWNKTIGGVHNDNAWSMVQTSDGGYVTAGFSNNFGKGDNDFWLVKTDASGTVQWNKAYGTTGSDIAYSVIQTSDGGYAMAGRQNGRQCWVVKTDSLGNMQWNQTYGDSNANSTGYSLIQTSDNGYAIAGFTDTFTGNTNTPYDFWLVKTAPSGSIQWDKKFGGPSEDLARSIVQTSDGGYALAGYTESYGAGTQDVWVVKTDALGNMQWNQTYGGANTDVANAMVKTNDGGYALAGSTESYGLPNAAFFLVKLDNAGPSPSPTSTPTLTPAFTPTQAPATQTPATTQAPTVAPAQTPQLTLEPTPTSTSQATPTPTTSFSVSSSPSASATASTTLSPTPTQSPSENISSTVPPWAPEPTNVAVAATVSVSATALISALASAAASSSTQGGSKVLERIDNILPGTVKKWLADSISSRRKIKIEEKAGSRFIPTRIEIVSYAVTMAVLTLCFAYAKSPTLTQIVESIPLILATSIITDFVKNYLITSISRHMGVWTEHRAWYLGLTLFSFSSILFKVPFSSPSRLAHYSPKMTKRINGLLSSLSIIFAFVFASVFAALYMIGFTLIGNVGLIMCLTGVLFDVLPIPPLGGKSVFDWNKRVWLALFVISVLSYAAMLIMF